ncbi:hypothetical protein F5887DRAFT_1079780 [Amanita rubescens]|nr:hypothetical protein F5887DRAFT_1079780 [Amanita rubescens]
MGMLGPLAGGIVEEGGIMLVEEGGIMFGLSIMFGLFIIPGLFIDGLPQEPPLQDMAEPPVFHVVRLGTLIRDKYKPFMPIGGGGLPIMLPAQEGPEHCAGWGGCCIEEGGDAGGWLPHAHGSLRLTMLMKERI